MLEEKIATLLQPVVNDMGFMIVDVEQSSIKGSSVLRISIEPVAQGVRTTVDNCVTVSKVISPT